VGVMQTGGHDVQMALFEGERDAAAGARFERICAGAGAYDSDWGKSDERSCSGLDE